MIVDQAQPESTIIHELQSSCNVPCEPALVRSAAGQTRTKLLAANFVKSKIYLNLTAASLKWKVNAWGIQGLPLCPASPQIEYSSHGWQIPATPP